MNPRRLFGYLFITAAAAGLLFSLVGLFVIWHYRPVVTQNVLDNLALLDQALVTTQDGLVVVGQVVQTTTDDVASLQTTTRALAKTIHDANPMLDSLTKLTGKDLPASITAAQISLASAQGSALLIDNTLSTLASIPLLPLAPYKPDVPLHTALAQISTSLDTLPPSLDTIASSMGDNKANLAVVEVELNKVSETTQGISSALGGAQAIIDRYKLVLGQLKERVGTAQRAAPGWITALAWILTLVLVWGWIAQLGLCMQGRDMLRDTREVN